MAPCEAPAQAAWTPPPTRVEVVVDTVYGVPIPDPYRWLEDGDSPEVREWTRKQNEYFQAYVNSYPQRDKIARRLEELISIGFIGSPTVRDSLYFFKKRKGRQNHAILYLRRGFNAEPEVLIDPNLFSEDGTVAMDWSFLSWDGSLIAYGVSASGTENSTLFVKRTADKAMLPDTIPFTRSASVAWLPDNSGFYYTRYPAPGTVPPGDETYYRRIYFHQLGSSWENDPLVFGDKLEKTAWPGVSLSPDGRWLFVEVSYGWTKSEIYLKDLAAPESDFVPIVKGIDAKFDIVPLNDRFLIRTNYQSPKYRVLTGNYRQPGIDYWKEVIPQRDQILERILVVNNHIVALSLKNASSVLEIYTLEGKFVREISLPTLGTVSWPSGEWDGKELFFSFHSYNMPWTVMRYDFAGDSVHQVEQVEAAVDMSDIVVDQVWYQSKDGTPVSMFLVHRKDLVRNGQNPTYLYGYGGFNVSMKPYFSQSMVLWLENGGVYAVANLRGGGEYGEEWHKAGMLENKQNVFDDFIAAAEYLFRERYTNPQKLVIAGGSNGGLLIGAVVTLSPDLCKAAVCSVPLLDMVRYHKFLMAQLWIPEYGTSNNPEQFKYLYAYSPYHNVKEGTAYPAVLFKTAESDNRVDPMHARKMTARMQAATASRNPIFLRTETKAGHGQGKPISKRLQELTDTWCFIFKTLGMEI
jgi:prolyl oligopeptidase